MMPYTPPMFESGAFNCPLCNAYSVQFWTGIATIKLGLNDSRTYHDERLDNIRICFCIFCKKYTLWVDKKMIHPLINGAPLPQNDMPEEIKNIYEEARGIMSRSPRSACALLRVALENLIDEIVGKNKESLYHNIGVLVKQGKLSDKIRKSMDILRITADSMLHPNAIDLENKDDRETAIGMFNLLNIITQILITDEKKINEYYDNLPQPQRDSIENRDNHNSISKHP